MKRKYISISVQKEIAARQKYKCSICYQLLPSCYQIDHHLPWALFKDNTPENLRAVCPNCHAEKTKSDNKKIKKSKLEAGLVKTFICKCNPGHVYEEKNKTRHNNSAKHLKFENEKLLKELIKWKDLYTFEKWNK